MTSINESLTPDLLFNIFKRLDCFETTTVRKVCKQWSQIIDQHKSFWRTLHLPKDSLKKWDPLIIQLFDRKSNSTLQKVEIGVRVEREHRDQLFRTLGKSKATLKHLFLRCDYQDSSYHSNFLMTYNNLESLRIVSWYGSLQVRLRRTSIKSQYQEDRSSNASPFKVLWYKDGQFILKKYSARFKNLVSLDSGADLSSSEWRKFLEGPSRNLKHLRIGFKKGANEDHSGVLGLEFPNLELLELNDGGEFPQWLRFPDTVKLVAHSSVHNLPSISELWTQSPLFQRNDIINRIPELKILSLSSLGDRTDYALILNERKDNVEAGLQVDGVEMEMIKTLIIPLKLSRSDLSDRLKDNLRKCREVVEVVEGDSQSRFIEVEV